MRCNASRALVRHSGVRTEAVAGLSIKEVRWTEYMHGLRVRSITSRSRRPISTYRATGIAERSFGRTLIRQSEIACGLVASKGHGSSGRATVRDHFSRGGLRRGNAAPLSAQLLSLVVPLKLHKAHVTRTSTVPAWWPAT